MPSREREAKNIEWVLPETLFCHVWRTTPVTHVIVGVISLGDEGHVGEKQSRFADGSGGRESQMRRGGDGV